MKKLTLIAIASSVLSIAAVGCNNSPVATHKLVATGGEHTVPLYPDEATYLKVSHKAQQGGVSGMVGNAQQDLTAKKIDDQTPVKVISSDDNGSEVQIVQGPMKGTAGFVANQNVD
jgi:transcription antitermination factor NusG